MALTRSKVREVPARIDEKMVSWLELEPPLERPETTALFERSTAKLGYVRNMQYVLAQFPALLQAQDALSRSLTVEFEGGLSHKERELIALVVSVHNRCEPCVFGHAAKLREITGDPVWVGKVEINYRRAKLSPRERAIADYALQITRAPEEIELKIWRRCGLWVSASERSSRPPAWRHTSTSATE